MGRAGCSAQQELRPPKGVSVTTNRGATGRAGCSAQQELRPPKGVSVTTNRKQQIGIGLADGYVITQFTRQEQSGSCFSDRLV